MMFEYLKKYLDKSSLIGYQRGNAFYDVPDSEIYDAEDKIGFQFPEQLRKFYREIGYGSLTVPHVPPPDYIFYSANRLHHPDVVADILLEGQSSGYIAQSTYDLLEPGDVPFFEIGDSTRFLVMKALSDNPNAVWSYSSVKIEDSLERFIWRLYYEDVAFYDTIIEAYWKTQESQTTLTTPKSL